MFNFVLTVQLIRNQLHFGEMVRFVRKIEFIVNLTECEYNVNTGENKNTSHRAYIGIHWVCVQLKETNVLRCYLCENRNRKYEKCR